MHQNSETNLFLSSLEFQLRYYENENDLNCRGIIDLADIRSVDTTLSQTLKKPLLEVFFVKFKFFQNLITENKFLND